MAVLMVNAELGVRRRDSPTLDGHGWEMPASWGPAVGPWPGRVAERADGSWLLGVDPEGWPVAEHDLIVEPGTGREWLVLTADLLRNNVDPSVNYVRVEAHERTDGGYTEAGDALR